MLFFPLECLRGDQLADDDCVLWKQKIVLSENLLDNK